MAKILVVDDNINNIEIIRQIFDDLNYEVFSSLSGKDILDVARSILPDIILLDIMMPYVDGFEACQLLKSDEELSYIPIIMVSAKGKGTDVKQALSLGAFDYIRKPIDEDEVVARVESALRYSEYNKKNVTLSTQDSLTGTINHKTLVESLEREIVKSLILDNTNLSHSIVDALNNTKSIAFAMMDIDFFKNVNDTYGHIAGDHVLIELVRVTERTLRDLDTIGRYGGEEFGIILRNVGIGQGIDICNRLRVIISNHDFFTGKEYIKITVSIGLYQRKKDEQITCQEMISLADKALYEAKDLGRNRCVEGIR